MARKPIYKHNPLYTRTSVRMALQNTLSKTKFGGLEKEDKVFIQEVLIECEKLWIAKNQNIEEIKGWFE